MKIKHIIVTSGEVYDLLWLVVDAEHPFHKQMGGPPDKPMPLLLSGMCPPGEGIAYCNRTFPGVPASVELWSNYTALQQSREHVLRLELLKQWYPVPEVKCKNCGDRRGWEDGDEGQWVTCAICCDDKGRVKQEFQQPRERSEHDWERFGFASRDLYLDWISNQSR